MPGGVRERRLDMPDGSRLQRRPLVHRQRRRQPDQVQDAVALGQLGHPRPRLGIVARGTHQHQAGQVRRRRSRGRAACAARPAGSAGPSARRIGRRRPGTAPGCDARRGARASRAGIGRTRAGTRHPRPGARPRSARRSRPSSRTAASAVARDATRTGWPDAGRRHATGGPVARRRVRAYRSGSSQGARSSRVATTGSAEWVGHRAAGGVEHDARRGRVGAAGRAPPRHAAAAHRGAGPATAAARAVGGSQRRPATRRPPPPASSVGSGRNRRRIAIEVLARQRVGRVAAPAATGGRPR